MKGHTTEIIELQDKVASQDSSEDAQSQDQSWLFRPQMIQGNLDGEITEDESFEANNEGIQGQKLRLLGQDYHPRKPFMWDFPKKMDDFFLNFDDRIIYHTQKYESIFLKKLSLLITGLVAIEIIMILPFCLFLVGEDGIATYLSYLSLFTCLISQIPKRFSWRYRPFMIARAKKFSNEKTSSFPSRAVTCATVYSYACCLISNRVTAVSESDLYKVEVWMPFFLYWISNSSFFCTYISWCSLSI
eukprot:TRINITY_DN6880_c0_g1_i1.p1 TRINITY_DN6880_c0_g1~~TRINITY_DN6880_c0_g1_i1.p1  ORF type:complete len:245 (-),score=54.94 TRINITY_DN6880_c0_g1_i1:588-1322(-)